MVYKGKFFDLPEEDWQAIEELINLDFSDELITEEDEKKYGIYQRENKVYLPKKKN